MNTYQVQTITTKTELVTVQAESEQDAISKVSNGEGSTGKNQLQVTQTAQLNEEA